MKKQQFIKLINFLTILIVFGFIFSGQINFVYASIGDAVFIYDETTPTTNVQQNLWSKADSTVGASSSPFAGSGTSKHIQTKGATTRKELLVGIQDSAGTFTVYKSTDEGANWTSQWSATVGDGNLKRFDISYEQTSGDALVVYSANVGTTNEILYQTWDGANWSGAQNLDPIRTSGTVYGIKGAERDVSNEIGIVWVDTNLDVSANLWTGSAWYGEPSAALSTTTARSGGASPSAVPTTRAYDLAFESQSGDLMVAWGNDAGGSQSDPRYIMKTAGGAWGAAAGTAITNLTEDGEMLDMSPSSISDRIALTTCAVDSGADCNFIIWSGSAWGTVASDTTSGAMIAGESSNNTEWLVDGANEVAVMTYGDVAAAGIDWYTSVNGATPTVQTDNNVSPIMGAVAERAGFSKAFPTNPGRAFFIFEDANSDIWVKIATLTGTTVAWSTPNGVAAALEANASVVGFNPIGFGFSRYGLSVSTSEPVATSITDSTATLNGNIANLTGGSPTVRGFEYSIDPFLTFEKLTTVESGSFGTGAFTANITDLSCNSTIYARAYATNAVETGYGSIESFTTDGPCAFIPPSSMGDGVFMYDETTPTTDAQITSFNGVFNSIGGTESPFAGSGTSKHIQTKGANSRSEFLSGIQDSAGLLTIYKSTDGENWTSQWSATVGDGNLKRFDISYEQTSGDALVVYSANVGTTNEILYQTWDGANWSGAQNLDPIRTSGTVYGIKGAERDGSNEIGIVWVDTNNNMSTNLWTGSAWYGEPTASLCSAALCTIARTGGSSPSGVPTQRAYDLAFESQSGDLMVVWGNDSLSTTQTDPRYIIKTAGGAWGAAAGTAITNLTEDGEMLDISSSSISDRIALTTCSLDTGSDCNFIIWSGSAWGTVASDTSSGTVISGESSNNTEWLVDGSDEVAIMTYADAAAAGIDWYTSVNGATPAVQTDNNVSPIMGAVAERAGFSKAYPGSPEKALFIFEDNNSDIWVKVARLSGTTVSWFTPAGISAAIETNASVVGFNPVGFGFNRYVSNDISISGTANGNDTATVKVAVNGVVHGQTGTISGGVWNISGVPAAADNIITVWVDGVTDPNETSAVTKYNSGNISGMVLNTNILTIGSNQNTSVSLADIDIYSCADDEDVMYSVLSNVLNVEGQTCAGSVNNSYSGEILSVPASNIMTVATAETVTTEKILNAGTISATGSPVFNLAGISGILLDNTGTFTEATSTVNVIGSSGTMTLLSNAQTFDKLTINAPSSTVSGGAAVTMASTATSRLYIQNGSFYGSGIQIVGTSTGGATMEMAAGTTLILGGGTATTFPINYTAGQITLNSASTVAYNATVNQTVSGVPTYGNLEITSPSGTPTKTLGANTVVAGNLTIGTANTLALSTFNFSVTGTSSITGTLNDASATGTNLFTGAVTINSGGIWTVSNDPAFEFRGGLACDSVAGFTSGAGIYTFSTNAQTISSSGGGTCSITNLTNSITSGNGLTISSAQPTVGTLLQSTNSILTFSGTVPTITTLTATASPNTVQYTSGSAQTVKGTTYHHLSKSGAGTATLGGATVLNGNLTISAGVLDISTLDFTTTGTSSITGTLTDSSATGTNLFTGTVTINSGGIWNNSGNDSFTFRGGFTNDSSSGFTSGSGIYTFDTNVQTISGSQAFTIANLTNNITSSTGLTFSGAEPTVTTLTQGGSAILTFSGVVPTIGTLDASISTNIVQYTGASQTVKNGTYHDLTISGSSTKTLDGVIDVNNNLLISAGTLSTGDYDITIGGNYTNSGVFSAGDGTVIFDAGDTGNTITGTLTGGSKFNNITFNNIDGAWSFGSHSAEIGSNFSVVAGAVTAPSTTLTIGEDFTNTPATTSSFVHNSGTIVLNTTGTSIVAGNSTFNNLTVTTDNKEVLFGSGDTFTVNGALTLTASAYTARIRIDSSTGHNDQWYINHQGTESIAYVDLKNSGCDASSADITMDSGSVDGSNNNKDCWVFIVTSRGGGSSSEGSATPDGQVGGGGVDGGGGSEGSGTPDEPVGGGEGGGAGGGDSGFLFKPHLMLASVPEVFEIFRSILASIHHEKP